VTELVRIDPEDLPLVRLPGGAVEGDRQPRSAGRERQLLAVARMPVGGGEHDLVVLAPIDRPVERELSGADPHAGIQPRPARPAPVGPRLGIELLRRTGNRAHPGAPFLSVRIGAERVRDPFFAEQLDASAVAHREGFEAEVVVVEMEFQAHLRIPRGLLIPFEQGVGADLVRRLRRSARIGHSAAGAVLPHPVGRIAGSRLPRGVLAHDARGGRNGRLVRRVVPPKTDRELAAARAKRLAPGARTDRAPLLHQNRFGI
jgi:hypothetical protein